MPSVSPILPENWMLIIRSLYRGYSLGVGVGDAESFTRGPAEPGKKDSLKVLNA